MVDGSTLDPIVQLRRQEMYRTRLIDRLASLLEGATLDRGQLESFVAALMSEVHCTQGPPGTGKSYVGVVLTRALMIIRQLWIAARPDVGTPPILVLSYKNHAIDEFVLDLVAKEERIKLIRIGGGKSSDPRLAQYEGQRGRAGSCAGFGLRVSFVLGYGLPNAGLRSRSKFEAFYRHCCLVQQHHICNLGDSLLATRFTCASDWS